MFVFFASDDKGVHPDNGIRFYQAALKAGVPAELHLFEPGGHGSELLVKQLVERITIEEMKPCGIDYRVTPRSDSSMNLIK
ncbi:MAG: hypothetical protein HC845_15340 [Akkermansiaceae bacterium]|nr:hypothetical protein [Akkermansiaceae bacterium]